MSDELKQLGRAIYHRRRALGWSQEQLALDAGLQRKTIYQVEAGLTDVRLDTLLLISKALGAPLHEIVKEATGEALSDH